MSKPDNPIKATSTKRFGSLLPALSLVTICVALAFYFCWLQTTYYQHYQPFFDSLSYYNEIHVVMTVGQAEGIGAALHEAANTNSTVFMPRLIAALVSPFVSPTRNFGVWLQMGEMFILMASLMYYYQRVHDLPPWTALMLVLPLLLMDFLYDRHGGISDFRMDLGLYLTYATACIWYLIAVHTLRWTHFFILGLAVAIACLFRATAPVYLAIALIPPTLWQLCFDEKRGQLTRGLVLSVVTVLAGSLWFFIINFEVLHHYYFVWNTDANAKLPVSQSWKHIKFATRHLGGEFLVWLVLMNVLLFWSHGTRGQGGFRRKVTQHLKTSFRRSDLRLLWFGVGPLAMLVLRGAGLNQYVCLPALAGIYLFLMDPFVKDLIWTQRRSGKLIATGLLATAAVMLLADGVRHHQKGQHCSMAAHQQIIKAMVADASNQSFKTASFGSTHTFFLHTSSLASAMRFDTSDAKFDGRKILIDGIQMEPHGIFSSCVAAANWNKIEGTSQQKIDFLITKANQELDYVLMPVETSAHFLQSHTNQAIINRHQLYLREKMLADPNWQPLGDPVKNRSEETVQLYRNNRRITVARKRNNHDNKVLIR